MDEEFTPPENFALWATLFEASMAAAAVGIGWLFAFRPAATFRLDAVDAGLGLAATVPALAFFGLCLKCPWGPLVRLRQLVDRRLVPLFRPCTICELAAISIVAGVGEEMLFRGLLQGGLAEWIGGPAGLWVGLAVGSLVFGLAHAITPTYAIVTALIGFYLGWLWIATGNLLAPIMTHAVYDFIALVYLAKLRTCRDDRDDQSGYFDREDERKNAN